MDLNDNTGEQNSLADAIGSFNPLWDSKDDPDVCFWRAVPVAKQILENEIAAANAVNRADDTVRRAYASMKDASSCCPPICRGKRPVQDRRGLCRLPQPARRLQCAVRQRPPHQAQQAAVPGGLAGKPEDKLREVSGLGLRFCHPSRFLITADDKATAIEACRRTLRAAGKKVSEE